MSVSQSVGHVTFLFCAPAHPSATGGECIALFLLHNFEGRLKAPQTPHPAYPSLYATEVKQLNLYKEKKDRQGQIDPDAQSLVITGEGRGVYLPTAKAPNS